MMDRREFLGAIGRAGLLACFPRAFPQARPPAATSVFYVGALSKKVLVVDEAQGKIIDQVPLETGIPRGLILSYDKKKIYVTTPLHGGIEVLDIASRKITNHFILDEGNRRVWFRNFTPDPQDRVLYAILTQRIKQVDRFEIEKPKFAVIDLAQQKIVKTVEYPKEETSAFTGGGLRVSPDGKYLYHFERNVMVFDTTDFKVVEKIELSKPPYPGMETVNLGPGDDPHDEPGMVTALFNSTDPIVHRRIFGIAKVDLTNRTFDFTPVGPSTTGMMGLRLTPDRKTGYTVAFQDSLGNRRSEFWVFDMATRKLVKQVEFPGPTSFRFTLSASGKEIYLFGSAPVLEIYDAATLKVKKTIDVNADLTTGIVVLPG